MTPCKDLSSALEILAIAQSYPAHAIYLQSFDLPSLHTEFSLSIFKPRLQLFASLFERMLIDLSPTKVVIIFSDLRVQIVVVEFK